MKTPIVAPSLDNPTPCKGMTAFVSPHPLDHEQARQLCDGCGFLAWCASEREQAQQTFGRESVEGTWHGELFVNGVVNKRGRKVRVRVA